jgi:Helix-turn-helix family
MLEAMSDEGSTLGDPACTMTSVMDTVANPARRMWALVEPVHAVTYFAPEALAAADALGLRGFWMGYAAQRIAPLGAAGPEVAAAAFFGFHPSRIARALPDAWRYTTPAAAVEARSTGVDAALRRLWGADVLASPELSAAAELAWRAAAGADCAGRVLAAANQALPRPEAPHLALWQACTTLREHRGDGHVAVLVAHGVSPVVSHLVKVAAGEADGDVLRAGRNFDAAAWEAGTRELAADGLLDAGGHLTGAGRELHDRIEAATDAAAASPWRALGAATDRLADLLAPLADAVVRSGTLPVPNAVGLVPVSQGPAAPAGGRRG